MKKLTAIALLALVFAANLLASEPVKVEFYEVHGDSAREIRKSLGELGPVGDDGVRHHGYTRWHVDWTYQVVAKGASCEIRSVETQLKTTMTLPRWNESDRASTGLGQEWNRYMLALRQHEDGHYNLAVAASNEIKQRLSTLTSVSGCQALRGEIQIKANRVLDEYRAKNVEYDAITDHGATQGARF